MTPGFLGSLLGAEHPVIMEVKRRSADGDDLLGARSVAEVVADYEAAGAPCLSVVTGRWFGGTDDLLGEVVRHTDRPVLQKDFVTSRAKVEAARSLGASAVLLTAALLTRSALRTLTDHALELGLTPFVEVASAAEAEMVLWAEHCVVAVNNKDIAAREQGAGDIDRSTALLDAVRRTGTPCPVSASGIDRPEVGARLLDAGFGGLLVGTGLLRSAGARSWMDELAAHRLRRAASPGS